MKPITIDASDFSGLPPPSPMKLENVRSWMAKNSGGPNLSASSASGWAKKRDEHDREQRPDERRGERGGQGLAALPLPRQRVAVERRRHRPGLAGMLKRIDVMAPPKSAPQ